jgi:hypothetical protein
MKIVRVHTNNGRPIILNIDELYGIVPETKDTYLVFNGNMSVILNQESVERVLNAIDPEQGATFLAEVDCSDIPASLPSVSQQPPRHISSSMYPSAWSPSTTTSGILGRIS